VLLHFYRASSVSLKDLRVGPWDLVVDFLHRKDFNLCWHSICDRVEFLCFAVGTLNFVFRTPALVDNP